MRATLRGAETDMRNDETEEARSWKRVNGLWFCPNCTEANS